MEIAFRNTQRDCRIDGKFLRAIMAYLRETEFSEFQGEACFHLVSKRRMAEVNWEFLQHEGPTDVITFDLAEDPEGITFLAEIYICPGVAIDQAKEFETNWQDELIRYHVHALLHLKGYDDLTPPERRKMKQQEERIMKRIRTDFAIKDLERSPTSSGKP